MQMETFNGRGYLLKDRPEDVIHGYNEYRYANGQIKRKGQCENGQDVGLWAFYHPDGKLHSNVDIQRFDQELGLFLGEIQSGKNDYGL